MSYYKWAALALIITTIAYGSKTMFSDKRGLRNNNAGNIRKGANWDGLSDNQTDSAFAVFKSPEHGIRALAKLIHNYQANYGITTIRGLVQRYAPSNENDTESYVQSVAKQAGISADAPIIFDVVMMRLVKAIIHHENGEQPYSDALLAKGISMAGVNT